MLKASQWIGKAQSIAANESARSCVTKAFAILGGQRQRA